MNIKHRIKKLENDLGVSVGGFCRCGTSYFELGFVVKPKSENGERNGRKINEVCDKCGKDVKPETYAQFLERRKDSPIILIKPKVTNEH